MKTILDPTFHYVDSAHTDLRRSFNRERKRLRKEAEALAAQKAAEVAQAIAAVWDEAHAEDEHRVRLREQIGKAQQRRAMESAGSPPQNVLRMGRKS